MARLVEGAIDFHVHPPWWMRDVRRACEHLARVEERAGFRTFVVIAFDGDEDLLDRLKPQDIARAAMESSDLLAYALHLPWLSRAVIEPEKEVERLREELKIHRRRPQEIVACLEATKGRGLPVISYNPSIGPERFADIVRRLEGRILGVKIYPTFHFTPPDHPSLHHVYRAVEDIGGLVIVHTGCDPGLWELPPLCRHARPSLVRRAARTFQDLTFIIAHLGAYSALKPGIFFDEALKALEDDNIYADTSAVDPLYVEKAVKEVGSEKLLFGSDYPYVQGLDVDSAAGEIEALGLEFSHLENIFRRNAEKVLSRHWRRNDAAL
ncbi:MAG: amidohydrolase family protein [Desulfurococcales archaeon]|nr:amidohydrolase family protein [Desulfurococcales archaeon]